MNKRGIMALLSSLVLAAALFAQSESRSFVQTGSATHELDSDGLVAAHAFLPIGQEVLVTNLESGAQITVTVTERISPSSVRIIDLSGEAAAAAAMFDDTTQVTIEATLESNRPAALAADTSPAAAPAASPATATTAAPASPATAPATSQATATTAAPAAPAATPAPATAAVPAPAGPATAPAASQATATTAAPASPATAPATATVPAPASPAAPAATASPAPASATPAPAAPSTGYTPTAEITPVVPPWETGHVLWPAPQNDPWLPELAQPWIAGIEREQRSPRAVGPAQTPTPAFAPPPVSAPRQEPAPPPVSAPAQAAPRVPSARVLPGAPAVRGDSLYRVQVGAFSALLNAREAFDRLLQAGFSPVFETQGGLTRVQIPWVRGHELETIGQRLYSIGFREVWIRAER